MKQPLKCPLCRSETEDVERSLWEDACFHYSKAKRESESSLTRKESIQTALQELDLISNEDPELNLSAKSTKVDVLQLYGNHQMTLNLIDEILELDKRDIKSLRTLLEAYDIPIHPDDHDVDDNHCDIVLSHPKALELIKELEPVTRNQLSGDVRITLLINKAEIYERMEKWEEAYDTYALTFFKVSHLPFNLVYRLHILMGKRRCLYHMCEFDGAIEVGINAISLCRQYYGVYKYVALSYKEKGDLERAKEFISKAVLYISSHDEEKSFDELNNINE
jgi:tetratricopeptide (TPR) repeat protein